MNCINPDLSLTEMYRNRYILKKELRALTFLKKPKDEISKVKKSYEENEAKIKEIETAGETGGIIRIV